MEYLGKLHETTARFPQTDIWNDSCALEELEYALERGAVGATTNPVIVLDVLKKESELWRETIRKLLRENPFASEDEIAWLLIERIAAERAKLLLPVFRQHGGCKGRLSIQTNPKYFNNSAAMLEQALRLDALGENMQVKIPLSGAGLRTLEEATYRGISVNATAVFTLSQLLMAADAVERGLLRREAEELSTKEMAPVCTLMIGRVDDHLKRHVRQFGPVVDPECLEWAGVAVFKKAYRLFQERGYRTRILTAGVRNHHHWSALIGADCAMTISHDWQRQLNESDISVEYNIKKPVEERFLSELFKIEAFRRDYDENGYRAEEFAEHPMFRATLAAFLEGYDGLVGRMRSAMLMEM